MASNVNSDSYIMANHLEVLVVGSWQRMTIKYYYIKSGMFVRSK